MKEMGKAYLLLFILWCLLQGTGADRVKIIPRIWQGDWFAASDVTFGPKKDWGDGEREDTDDQDERHMVARQTLADLAKDKKMMMTSRRRNSA